MDPDTKLFVIEQISALKDATRSEIDTTKSDFRSGIDKLRAEGTRWTVLASSIVGLFGGIGLILGLLGLKTEQRSAIKDLLINGGVAEATNRATANSRVAEAAATNALFWASQAESALKTARDPLSAIIRGRVRAHHHNGERWKVNPKGGGRLEQVVRVEFDPPFPSPPLAMVSLSLVQSATTAEVQLLSGVTHTNYLDILFIAGPSDTAAILDAEYLIIPRSQATKFETVDHFSGDFDGVIRDRNDKVVQTVRRSSSTPQ